MLFLTFEYEIKNISLFFLFARQICYGKVLAIIDSILETLRSIKLEIKIEFFFALFWFQRKDLQRRRRERTRRQNQKQKKRREQRRMRRSCQRRRTQLLLRFLALISFETSCLVQYESDSWYFFIIIPWLVFLKLKLCFVILQICLEICYEPSTTTCGHRYILLHNKHHRVVIVRWIWYWLVVFCELMRFKASNFI